MLENDVESPVMFLFVFLGFFFWTLILSTEAICTLDSCGRGVWSIADLNVALPFVTASGWSTPSIAFSSLVLMASGLNFPPGYCVLFDLGFPSNLLLCLNLFGCSNYLMSSYVTLLVYCSLIAITFSRINLTTSFSSRSSTWNSVHICKMLVILKLIWAYACAKADFAEMLAWDALPAAPGTCKTESLVVELFIFLIAKVLSKAWSWFYLWLIS